MLFSMARIPWIGHDRQAPFWVVVLGVSKTSVHMHNIRQTPKINTDSECLITVMLGGSDQRCSDPFKPSDGGVEIFVRAMTDGPF